MPFSFAPSPLLLSLLPLSTDASWEISVTGASNADALWDVACLRELDVDPDIRSEESWDARRPLRLGALWELLSEDTGLDTADAVREPCPEGCGLSTTDAFWEV